MTIKPGSGHQYFDINDKLNNKELWGLDIAAMNHEDMMANAVFIIGHHFSSISDEKDRRKTTPFIEQILSSKSFEIRRYALTQRAKGHPQLHFYENNRDNIVSTIANLGFRRLDQKDKELLKSVVLAGIAQGLHPLEKSSREGATAMALLFRNSQADIEMFEFFSSLSPKSLLDLDEEGNTAMALMASANRGLEYFKWLANALPIEAIEKNMESIKKKVKSSNRVRLAYETMQERKIIIERNLLSSSISSIQNSPNFPKPTIKV